MNTGIYYLYRDGSNYKNMNRQVVSGELTDEQKEKILESCDEGEYFIPRQVGLPEERFDDIDEDDHAWFEMSRMFKTDMEPTVDLSAQEMYENFLKASGNWNANLWLEGGERE